MLKIGEFSRISQVTVKTLHHYDDIDLLKPAHIDQFTNYRYYSIEQIPRIHRIMVLKELGLSLEQIAIMIDSNLSTEQLIRMLALKEAEVQQRIDEEEARLARIRFHIRQIDMEDEMSQLDIRIKKVEPVRALTIRFLAKTHDDIGNMVQEVTQALFKHKLLQNGQQTSPGFQIVYAKEYTQHNVDNELVFPIPDTWQDNIELSTPGTLTIREVPGMEKAATYLYKGNPDDINENLVDVERWVLANGYQLSDEVRIVTLQVPAEMKMAQLSVVNIDWEQWLGEIQYPLVKA